MVVPICHRWLQYFEIALYLWVCHFVCQSNNEHKVLLYNSAENTDNQKEKVQWDTEGYYHKVFVSNGCQLGTNGKLLGTSL